MFKIYHAKVTLKNFVFLLFNTYDYKEMSPSQKQAIITLIEKKGKDRNYLENWRPISLTNVDAKISSKVIAARIIPVLPTIINSTQTGYVKGRFIGEAARSIIDIIDYTKKQNIYLAYYCSLISKKLLIVSIVTLCLNA